jgi:hypothetical protein
MQVAQSISSISYVKGSSNDIIFKLYKILSIVKGNLEEYIRPYIYIRMDKGSITLRETRSDTGWWITRSRCRMEAKKYGDSVRWAMYDVNTPGCRVSEVY